MGQRQEDPGPGFLRWRSWGSARRRAFLLHDFGSSSLTWWRVAERLAEAGWRVKAVDLPSHGASPRADAALTPKRAAEWLALELTGRPIDLVVGHGFGGAVAEELRNGGLTIDRLVVETSTEDVATLTERLRTGVLEAQRDPEGMFERVRAAHPGWHVTDCRHYVRDLACMRLTEVLEGLEAGWPPPPPKPPVVIIGSSGEVEHRIDPEEWLHRVLD